MKCAILQSNYIPWKGYFDLIANVDHFIFYDSVQYTKNDWRNRNKIKTKDGIKWITIPVSVPSLDSKINEVLIADRRWGKNHWKTIQASYARCKYFSDYSEIFADFYTNSQENNLHKVNVELIKIVCKLLGITTKISEDTEFELKGDRVSRLVNLASQVGATSYCSGPAAQSYLTAADFESAGIGLEWMDYSNYPEYEQRFPPFAHAVSILDLIFNEGPNATDFMKFARPGSCKANRPLVSDGPRLG